MQENRVSEETQASAPASPSTEGIRVTDRRRINLENDAKDARASDTVENVSDNAPSVKPTYVEQLEARAQAAEQKLVDVQSRFEQLRSQLRRETDETRQRLNRAADERVQHEKADFIATLLPVADNLRRAIEAAEEGGSFESMLDGVRGTANSFESALAAAGVEPIESTGALFDPELHEAVDTAEVGPERDGTVTAEYSRGYKMGDRLLRPARVQVGRTQDQAKKAVE